MSGLLARERSKHAGQPLQIAHGDAALHARLATPRGCQHCRAWPPSRNVPRSARGTPQVPAVEAAGLDLDRDDQSTSGAPWREHHDVDVAVAAPPDAREHAPLFGDQYLQCVDGFALGAGSSVRVTSSAKPATGC